ncbi:MAG: CHAT domain-containing tetratricopeptide repeat protein [Acidimicrobiia bacterium]
MVDAPPIPVLEVALRVVDSVHDHPQKAREQAESLIDQVGLDPEATAVAWWALGLAARQLNDLDGAELALQRALKGAIEAGLVRRVGQIRSSLALVLLYRGDTQGALDETELAMADLSGPDLARNEMQIGLILQRIGRLDDALVHYRSALTGLRRSSDRLAEARLLSNRGVLHGYRGELDLGVSDLEAARLIAEDLGQELIVAASAHNLGFLEGRRGDVPAALAWFDQAEAAYEALGRPPGMTEVLWANRGELLLTVGLYSEAEQAVNAAISGLEKTENQTDLSEARLLAAEVALAARRPDDALEAASVAASEFTEQDRRAWRLLAEYAALRARFEDQTSGGAKASDAARLAEELAAIGLPSEAQHCHLLAGRIAMRDGALKDARRQLGAASGARRRGSALDRAKAWHAEALLRQAEGNARGSTRAIEAGFKAIRDYRLTLGAADLRSHAAAQGLDLAVLAIEHGVASGSPWQVLKAVESWRAESSQVASVRPPSDPELTRLLSELRRTSAEIREAAMAGGTTQPLILQEARIEHEIKMLSRRLRGSGHARATLPTNRDDIVDRLGDRRLISYFKYHEEIHAVTVYRGSIGLERVVEADRASDEVSSLLFSLTRLAHGAGSPRSLEAASVSVDQSLDQLREWLLDPFVSNGEAITVVPTAALHRLPWPALDPGRILTVVPSLESWVIASSSIAELRANPTAALVAGPDLPGAVQEVSRIARLYETHRRRTGRNARADLVLQDIEGSDVAHLAAHGTFRFDNPSFSSLQMHDGPLTVYDFEQIKTPPAVMVLSSCDTAVTKVVAGDELLGLSSALIGIGVSSLVAPVVPIDDEASTDLMVALHRGLVGGDPTPVALAKAIFRADPDDDPGKALRSSFVVFGA